MPPQFPKHQRLKLKETFISLKCQRYSIFSIGNLSAYQNHFEPLLTFRQVWNENSNYEQLSNHLNLKLIDSPWHGLRTPDEASIQNFWAWADKFWGIWDIFGRTISPHFGAVCSLSMLSINQPFFLQKHGLGFRFGHQRIRDLAIMRP